MAPFSANGTDKPRYALGEGASLFSYLNKKLPKDRIEELLRVANYLAAPFGSYEYTLVNYGEAGLHHTMDAAGPKLTAVGSKEVAQTYQFLATGPTVTALPGYPDWVKAYTAWQGNAAQYGYKSAIFGLNYTEPAKYADINTPVEAVISQVIRGTKSIADFTAAVATWRSAGGDALRRFYSQVRQDSGTA
jgi:putative aldouronate transport system substrate-binding protein